MMQLFDIFRYVLIGNCRKMKAGNGFLFDIQAKSNNELLRKVHQVNVENAKSSK